MKKYGWREEDNGMIFIANQDENIKTKNITEKIDFESAAAIMAASRWIKFHLWDFCLFFMYNSQENMLFEGLQHWFVI